MTNKLSLTVYDFANVVVERGTEVDLLDMIQRILAWLAARNITQPKHSCVTPTRYKLTISKSSRVSLNVPSRPPRLRTRVGRSSRHSLGYWCKATARVAIAPKLACWCRPVCGPEGGVASAAPSGPSEYLD
jgi:hypothetical protein